MKHVGGSQCRLALMVPLGFADTDQSLETLTLTQPSHWASGKLPTGFGWLSRLLLFQKPRNPLKLYGKECVSVCVYIHAFFWRGSLCFIKISVGFLPPKSQEPPCFLKGRTLRRTWTPLIIPCRIVTYPIDRGLPALQSSDYDTHLSLPSPSSGVGAVQEVRAVLGGLEGLAE